MENSIDLIIGPMYSAKTTELIRRLTIYAELGLKVLYINSCLDDRSDSIKEVFSTHNPTLQFADLSIANIHSIKTQKLNNILSNACLYDIIGIDEGQLFIDLKTFTLALVERYNKKVIDYFNLYGNAIAKNCTLTIDKIPREIFNSKKIVIRTNSDGSEIIHFYDFDGDVFMRNF